MSSAGTCCARGCLPLEGLSRRVGEDKPVGLDPFLTQTELAIKRRLKGLFNYEQAKNTPNVFWRGCRLLPIGKSSSSEV